MAFNFDRFISQTNDLIDRFQKKKDEKDKMRFDQESSLANRQMKMQEQNSLNQTALAKDTLSMQKKAADTAADTEYYRKKNAFDVQAGNMNPDTYDMVYGGAAANGGYPNAKGGLRGKGGKDNGEPDYEKMLTESFKAAKESGDQRAFTDYATNELPALQKLFQQQQQGATGNTYSTDKTKKDLNFDENVSMSRDANGRMKFGMNQQNAVTGFGNVRSAARGLRVKDPMLNREPQSPLGNNPSNPFYNPPATRLQMGSQAAMQPAITTPQSISPMVQPNPVKSKFGLDQKGSMTTIPITANDPAEQRRNKRLKGGFVDSPFKSMYQ